MTPSVIRRFARYRGIDLADVHEDDVLVTVMRGIRTNSETQAEAHDRLIQSLTRIEDAELIMKAANPMPSTAWGQGFVTANESAYHGFLRLAGIDPAKWREVKDEEA